MSFHSGHGGGVTIDPSGANTVVLGIREWTLTKSSRLAETTNSETAGWATFINGVDEAQGTFIAYWDDTQVPDTDVALDVGDAVLLRLEVGAAVGLGKFYQFVALVESLEVRVNNQQGAVEYSVTFRASGAVTDPVT